MSRRERCHCGCDKQSHYRDQGSGVRGACLNHRCDCEKYVNEFDPLPPPKPKGRRKGHPSTCQCFDCKQLGVIPEERKTDPWGWP